MNDLTEWLEAPQTKRCLKRLRKINDQRKALLGEHIIKDPLNAGERGLLNTALEYKAFDAVIDSLEDGEFVDDSEE